jgi:hypothetical protein
MKKILQIISVFAVSLPLMFNPCIAFAKDIKGDGKLITKSIPVSKFSKVEIETNVEVNYSQAANKGSVEFTVDANLWEYYDISTKAGVLHIKLKEQYKNKFNLKPTKSLLTVSSEHLEAIDMAGSSTFNFDTAFASEKLIISLAGSGKVISKKFPVSIKECELDLAGSASVHLNGDIQQAKIDIAGSANVNALECMFTSLSVEIAGSGKVEAFVVDKLNVEIAGSGSVHYKGNPKVSTDVAGSGKVKKL